MAVKAYIQTSDTVVVLFTSKFSRWVCLSVSCLNACTGQRHPFLFPQPGQNYPPSPTPLLPSSPPPAPSQDRGTILLEDRVPSLPQPEQWYPPVLSPSLARQGYLSLPVPDRVPFPPARVGLPFLPPLNSSNPS